MSQAEAEENPLCPEKEGFHKMIQKAQDHYRRMKPIHESSCKIMFFFSHS